MVNGSHVELFSISLCTYIMWDFLRVFIIILHKLMSKMTNFSPTLRKLKYFGVKLFLSPSEIGKEGKGLKFILTLSC